MSDILNEAQALIQCKACSWYRNCVLPMRLTEEDLRRQLESSMPGFNVAEATEHSMQQLLSSLVAAAENSILEGCPVFISRLRANHKLAQRIKRLMQEWSKESEEQTPEATS
jgi:hypothetical protein